MWPFFLWCVDPHWGQPSRRTMINGLVSEGSRVLGNLSRDRRRALHGAHYLLMGDKGDEMQVPFALGASGQLKDLGFDDETGRFRGVMLKTVPLDGGKLAACLNRPYLPVRFINFASCCAASARWGGGDCSSPATPA